MRFVLAALNSKYIHTNPAVRSLKAFAERGDHKVEIREYTINHNLDQILRDLYESRPDWIGFSCYLWNRDYVFSLAESLRKVLPEVPVWLGGPEVSFDPESVLKKAPFVTGIQVGEGEWSFRQLLEHYETGVPALSEIPGICFRLGEEILHNPAGAPGDLGELPFAYEEPEELDHKIVYYESSRGCPFSCAYCLSSLEKSLRFKPLSQVKKELAALLERKIPQVKFTDRTFNCKKEHAMEIWRFLRDHDNGVTNFHFEIAADLLTEEMLDFLAGVRPGQFQFEAGVQSVNPQTLEAIRRTMDFEKVARTAQRLRAGHNIHLHLDLIAGLPYEGYESFGRSFDRVYALKPEQLQLGFLKVLKGTAMEQLAEDYGLLYRSEPPYEVLETRWLSFGELARLKEIEEAVETYYNSGQFAGLLSYLERFFSSPFGMYEALAAFLKSLGSAGEGSSRTEKCRRLFTFACRQVPGEREVFRQLAAFDLYSREKCKSRPDFLADQSGYREEVSQLLAREGRAHRLFPKWREEPYRSLLHHLHCEVFELDIRSLLETGEKKPGLWYTVFDYGDRDPLTHNGAVRFEAKEQERNDG